MSVTQGLMTLGSWTLTLTAPVPQSLLDRVQDLGHIVVHDARQSIAAGDGLLSTARYAGVMRRRKFDDDHHELGGPGMGFWLGTEDDDHGAVIEPPGIVFSAADITGARALIPTTLRAGRIGPVRGSYSGTVTLQTCRKALTVFCASFADEWGPAEWRVNPDGTVDFGSVAALYQTTPTAIIARRGAGSDLRLRALSGMGSTTRDSEDWTSRVVLVGADDEVVGTAELAEPENPYRDLFGQPVVMTRIVRDSSVTAATGGTLAALQLAQRTTIRTAVDVEPDGEFDIRGAFVAGDYVWAWDPAVGLADPANEDVYGGQRINPVAIRVVEVTWPITVGMGVSYRHGDGTWLDLTDYVQFESDQVQITVGAAPRSLLT